MRILSTAPTACSDKASSPSGHSSSDETKTKCYHVMSGTKMPCSLAKVLPKNITPHKTVSVPEGNSRTESNLSRPIYCSYENSTLDMQDCEEKIGYSTEVFRTIHMDYTFQNGTFYFAIFHSHLEALGQRGRSKKPAD